MKNILGLLIFISSTIGLISCDDDAANICPDSAIIGKWEYVKKLKNGVEQELADDKYCTFDQLYEFRADGKIITNDPCQQNNFVLSEANWEIDGKFLSIDYYAIPGISIRPEIEKVNDDSLVLRQMYGDIDVIHHVFKRTNKDVVDYAGDFIGIYSGWMNFDDEYIRETNRGDSVWVTVKIDKLNWGSIGVVFNGVNILGTSGSNLKVDSVYTKRTRNLVEFILDSNLGSEALMHNDLLFDMNLQGNQGRVNQDSLYLTMDFSRMEYEDPGNTSSNVIRKMYQFQRFRGIRE